jgi:hypothetical protein
MAILAPNHAFITGGGGICDVLTTALQRVQTTVQQAVEDETRALHASLQAQAAAHPDWSDISDYIGQWVNGDGDPAFGVQDDSEAAQRAVRAEYGDETTPPTGLLRMGTIRGAQAMGRNLTDRFRQAGF